MAESQSVSNDSIYKLTKLKENIHLSPKDINKNINEIVLNKLKNKIEGKCIKDGFIRKNSITILSRSLGNMNNSNFESGVHYAVVYSAEVCNLYNGQIIEAEVDNIDKSQVFAYW